MAGGEEDRGAGGGSPPGRGEMPRRLAQLLFDKLDVLADLRIVLLQPQLLGRELLVLARRVEVAGARAGNQLDLVAHLSSSFAAPRRWPRRGFLGRGTRSEWRGRRDSNPRPPA